jgi:hypothetical protein
LTERERDKILQSAVLAERKPKAAPKAFEATLGWMIQSRWDWCRGWGGPGILTTQPFTISENESPGFSGKTFPSAPGSRILGHQATLKLSAAKCAKL